MNIQSNNNHNIKNLYLCTADALPASSNSTLLLLLEQNAEIFEQVKVNTRMLQELLKKQQGTENLKAARIPENLRSLVPIKTTEDLIEVELRLKNADTYKQMVSPCLF